MLARGPKALTVLAARGIGWSDCGEPGHIVRTLRRFDLRPRWLPAPAVAQAHARAG